MPSSDGSLESHAWELVCFIGPSSCQIVYLFLFLSISMHGQVQSAVMCVKSWISQTFKNGASWMPTVGHSSYLTHISSAICIGCHGTETASGVLDSISLQIALVPLVLLSFLFLLLLFYLATWQWLWSWWVTWMGKIHAWALNSKFCLGGGGAFLLASGVHGTVVEQRMCLWFCIYSNAKHTMFAIL